MGFVGVVSLCYPDKPSVHRGFEGGLDRELGGKLAVIVSETSKLSSLWTWRKEHKLTILRHVLRMDWIRRIEWAIDCWRNL